MAMHPKSLLPLLTALAGTAGGYWTGSRRPFAGEENIPPHTAPPLAFADQKADGAKRASPGLQERFALLAATTGADDALAQALALTGTEREQALRALLTGWISASGMEAKQKERMIREASESANKPNALILLAALLRDPALTSYRGAWMAAFSDNPVRAEMFTWLLGAADGGTPERIAAVSAGWLPWEKASFLRGTHVLWAAHHPEQALERYRAHPEDATDDLITAAVSRIAHASPDKAREILAHSTSALERTAAARALAEDLAIDTRAAVQWADSLPEGPEKEAAHDAIYKATPRGVGAVLGSTADGLPEIKTTLPAGPLARAGFQSGDLLAGIEQPGGQWQNFAGASLQDITAQLRGEPGTEVTVVAMRRDPLSGAWQEYRSVVAREQIMFSKQGGQ